MNDAFAVRRVERVGDFDPEIEQLLGFQRSAERQLAKSLAFQILHRDERLFLVLPDLVNGANVRVIQSRSCSCLATKAFKSKLIAGHVIGKKLQGGKAAKLGVFGLVNDTHATTAQLLHNAVVRDRLA
jgi:hypothetical protein